MSRSMAATEPKEVKTKSQRAKELKDKLAILQEEAKTELLEAANAAITELADLGFVYHLLEESEYQSLTAPRTAPVSAETPRKRAKADGTGKTTPKVADTPSGRFNPGRFCKTCQIAGHDTKAHNFHKEKFTSEELTAKGWQPPQAS